MSYWLKWRLGALFGFAALLIGASILHAQNDYPDPAKTPEAAGEQFFALLQAGEKTNSNDNSNRNSPAFDWTRSEKYLGCISRVQAMTFSQNPPENGPEKFFALLAEEAHQSQFSGRITHQDGNNTYVEVTPDTNAKPREVVVVPEDGGYRIDLFATYGLWNNLKGADLDKEIYKYTGTVTPNLASDTSFLGNQRRSQCQSNLKQLMLGVLMYSQDYDEKMPPARRWQKVTMPYLKAVQIYNCPSLDKGKSNGYAYNQNLSQVNAEKLESTSRTVNLYETSNLKGNVFGPGTGRAYRHFDGWNLAFADGHIKWFSQKLPVENSYQWTAQLSAGKSSSSVAPLP